MTGNSPSENQLEVIRRRWANKDWPNIGWHVHGQARADIDYLLSRLKPEPHGKDAAGSCPNCGHRSI